MEHTDSLISASCLGPGSLPSFLKGFSFKTIKDHFYITCCRTLWKGVFLENYVNPIVKFS